MKLIPLTQGKFAQVDDVDFDLLSKFKWQAGECCVKGTFRAQRGRKDGSTGLMHREIMGVTDPKIYVDHQDGNPLNNLRSNIRIATPIQNGQNQGVPTSNTSGYKGVCWSKPHGKWRVGIRAFSKKIFVGLYESKEDAARAYNCVARRLQGDFARFNVVDPPFPECEISLDLGRCNAFGFRGIHRQKNRFIAEIKVVGVKHRLGRFDTPEDAARAYDAASKIHYGSKAKLNFPNE